MKEQPRDTSWQKVHTWYDNLVGTEGHYYHQHVILPKLLPLLQLQKEDSLLDIACGQGVLAKNLPKITSYVGIDLSRDLIQKANEYHKKEKEKRFLVADVTKPLPLKDKEQFSKACCILALQNMEHPENLFKEVAPFLKKGARCIFVLNHPAFRIPRQSDWSYEEKTKTLLRSLRVYMSSQEIPIQTHPSKKESSTTWTYHHPISSYTKWLFTSGFTIEFLEEWCSDKESTGARARAENRARKEFPLFLTIVARKL